MIIGLCLIGVKDGLIEVFFLNKLVCGLELCVHHLVVCELFAVDCELVVLEVLFVLRVQLNSLVQQTVVVLE